MQLTTTSAALWLATIMVQAAALYLAQKRKQPELWLFLAYKLTKSLTMVAVSGNLELAAWVYWIGSLINPVFDFVVLRGIFRQIFQPYSTLPSNRIATWFAGVVFLIAVSTAVVLYLPSMHWMIAMDRAAGSIIGAALFVILAYRKALGLPWRHHVSGITAAYCVYTCASVVAKFGYDAYMPRAAWLLMLIAWCAVLSRPLKDSIIPTHEQLNELKKTVNSVRALKSQLSRKTA
jgi:hypothetical protein